MKSKLKNGNKIAEVLRKAAGIMDGKVFQRCCWAISIVRCGDKYGAVNRLPEYKFFKGLFFEDAAQERRLKKAPIHECNAWWGGDDYLEARIIALLLAADIAESGGLQ